MAGLGQDWFNTGLIQGLVAGGEGARYSNEALADAREKLKAAEEAESKAFAAAVAEWRRGSGPVTCSNGWVLSSPVMSSLC